MAFDETYNEPESTEVLVKSLDPEHPRSGLAAKQGVTVLNAPGTVDAGYRGEIKVPLINLDPKHTAVFHPGDRIAQLVIQRYVEARFIPAETLPGSDRAERGFGSTGVAS